MTALVLVLLTGRLQAPDAPAFATIAGVTVGVSSIEDLERRNGPGFRHTGGHPGGAREWRFRGTGWSLDADGFDYGKRGRVIDYVVVGDGSYALTKRTWSRASSKDLRFVSVVSLGMKRGAVLKALERKLDPPFRDGEDLVWIAYGHSRSNGDPQNDKTLWTATLRFSGDRLTWFSIEAE